MKQVIIFGAGKKGNILFNRLCGWRKVAFFSDNDISKQGKILRDTPIISYKQMLALQDDFDIILSTKIPEMEEQLQKDGVKFSVFSGGTNGYFGRADVLEALDKFYYDKWCYDREVLEIVFTEKKTNWFREDSYSVKNNQLIKDLLTEGYCAQDYYSYDDYWEDEKYCNRPDMRLVHKIITNSKTRLSICDLACGHGELIKKLAEDGHEVFGVDCNPQRVQFLNDEDIAAQCTDIEAFTAAKKFDCVIMLQILEHVQNVVQVVDKVHSLLRPGGSVFAAVPLGKNCDCAEHVRHFTENRLANLFTDDCWIIDNILKVPYQNDQYPNNILLQATRL